MAEQETCRDWCSATARRYRRRCGGRDARTGAAAGDGLREGRLGEMAGEGRWWLRGPSPERQAADSHAPRLAAALADYGLAMDFERHQILTQYREEQALQRVEIPRPSARLSELLRAENHEQVRRLKAEPNLRLELEPCLSPSPNGFLLPKNQT